MNQKIVSVAFVVGAVVVILLSLRLILPITHTKQQEHTADSLDVWIYPEASIVSSEQENRNFNAELASEESVSNVSNWYTKKLNQQGWIIESFSNEPGNNDIQNIRASKDDQYFIISAVKNPDNKTKIILSRWKKIVDEEDLNYQDG